MEKGSRPGAALLLCGALLVVPLVLLQSDSGASAPPSRGGAASGALASSGPEAEGPSWKLTSQTQAQAAATPTVPAVAPTTTVPPTTTTAPEVTLPAANVVARSVPAVVPTTTTAPPTTTTVAAPVTNESAHYGQVTYYAHPAGTCASPFLPFGTVVRVTNPANGASITCLVNDREADTARSIDLATATFAELAPLSQGVIDAELSW
jgi:rare lipoprotein A